MDRKGSKKNINYLGRQQKRSFCGNQHTIEKDTEFTSTSAANLNEREDTDIPVSREFGYYILNFFTVFSTIFTTVKCKVCESDVTFKKSAMRGVGFKIIKECKCGLDCIPSCPLVNNAYEINRRLAFVMRLLGVGREGINLFCGLMDLGKGFAINTYYDCLENIYTALSVIYEKVVQRAIAEEKQKSIEYEKPENQLTVSGGRI